MILLAYVIIYFKYLGKRQQASNHVGYYSIFLKNATWFKPISPWLRRSRCILEFLTEHVCKEARIRIPFNPCYCPRGLTGVETLK